MTRGQLEEMRYSTREWKAGYAAAQAHQHRRLTAAALVVGFVALGRRMGFPFLGLAIWTVALVVFTWPLLLILVGVELHRRHQVRQALAHTHADDPFPDPS